MVKEKTLEKKCRLFDQAMELPPSTIRKSYERLGCYNGCDGHNYDCKDYIPPRKVVGVKI